MASNEQNDDSLRPHPRVASDGAGWMGAWVGGGETRGARSIVTGLKRDKASVDKKTARTRIIFPPRHGLFDSSWQRYKRVVAFRQQRRLPEGPAGTTTTSSSAAAAAACPARAERRRTGPRSP